MWYLWVTLNWALAFSVGISKCIIIVSMLQGNCTGWQDRWFFPMVHLYFVSFLRILPCTFIKWWLHTLIRLFSRSRGTYNKFTIWSAIYVANSGNAANLNHFSIYVLYWLIDDNMDNQRPTLIPTPTYHNFLINGHYNKCHTLAHKRSILRFILEGWDLWVMNSVINWILSCLLLGGFVCRCGAQGMSSRLEIKI